jgi:hypothetical protein
MGIYYVHDCIICIYRGVRVSVESPPTTKPPKNKIRKQKTVQRHDQDSWSIFVCFQKKNIQHPGFSQLPSLETNVDQSAFELCSSYVVSDLTLAYSEAQTRNVFL